MADKKEAEEASCSEEEEGGVDSVIETAAEKANLSVLNVKSILHHVLKDKRVLSVIQQEAGEGNLTTPEDDIIQPRLTRSKVREAVAMTMSPEKIARMRAINRSPTRPGSQSVEELLNISIHTDDSSDEDYAPTPTQCTHEDRDSTLSPLSVDGATPTSSQTTPPPNEELETATLLASLSDVILNKDPASSEEQDPLVFEEEEIAHRTRSKFTLTDTPISAIEGIFPEDSSGICDMDTDDLHWHQWLQDLMNPPDSLGEEMEEDGEYHYLAEADVVEKEELRNDRAVKIPQREVDDLIAELLHPPAEGLDGLLGMDPTTAYLLESLGLSTPAIDMGVVSDCETTPVTSKEGVGCHLSLEQAQTLSQQVRQHFQLLLQTFVLCACDSSLFFLSQVAAQAIEELHSWSEGAGEGTNSAVWFVPGVKEGMKLVQQMNATKPPVTVTTSASRPCVPEYAQDIFMTTPTFWTYPHLLPAVGFGPVAEGKSSSSKIFSTAEDYLLVLGMDHYGSASWTDIKNYLLPVKTVKQLQLRVKNQCSKRTGENAIKHYKKTKELRIPFNPEEEKVKDLPLWILTYHKKRLEREKEVKRHNEELCKQTAKLQKMIGLVSAGATPHNIAGSKRNLITSMTEATNDKKSRVEAVKDDKKRICIPQSKKQLRRRTSMVVTGQEQHFDKLQHLLLAAGLKPSDVNIKFAYDYLVEVKRTLPCDSSVYQEFLQLLARADTEQWSTPRLFSEVLRVLGAWPHLVYLFTELMEDKDCCHDNAVKYKMELTGVHLFTSKLKVHMKYK